MSHLTDSAVEQMVDGLLTGEELAKAEAHVSVCGRCTAHLEASRAIIEMLAALPRFAPSPGFADCVMAKVRVVPTSSPLFAWMRHWTPETRRGWMLLVASLLAPMLPLLGIVTWVAMNPLVTADAVASWTFQHLQSALLGASTTVARWGVEFGIPWDVDQLMDLARGVPLDALIAALAILAIATPLSAWSLVRLVRTPTGNVTYAN